MKTKIEKKDFDLEDSFDLDNLFHDRDIYYNHGCCSFNNHPRNFYQYSIEATHRPSGITVRIYETSIDRDDAELIKKMKLEAYEELRYLVHKSPRYLSLMNNKTILRNRLLSFQRWMENEE